MEGSDKVTEVIGLFAWAVISVAPFIIESWIWVVLWVPFFIAQFIWGLLINERV